MKSVKQRIIKEKLKVLKPDIDERVISLIADYPFKFAHARMAAGDIRPVRLRYFAAFVPKTSFINEQENKRVQHKNSDI